MLHKHEQAYKFLILLFCLLVLQNCANYRPHYKANAPIFANPTDQPEYSTFFVGDLAYEPTRGLTTLAAMSKKLSATKNSSLLLLGDLVGPQGFNGKTDQQNLPYLNELIAELNTHSAPVFYTPGENELGRNSDFEQLRKLEKYFAENSSKRIRFMPNRACSGPDDKQIYDRIGLIGINSAWYLAEWNNAAEVSEGCDYNDRDDLLAVLADEIKGYRDQVKIVMMHHPLHSNGNRNGNYSIRQHLFPLTDLVPAAYLPLPGIGSIARGIEASSGSGQDLTSLRYQEFIDKILAKTEDEDNIIFLGGHEHNLMYLNGGNHHIISAGSGSRRAPAAKGKGTEFAYGAIGFGQIDFHPSGSVYLSFFQVDRIGRCDRVFYQQIIEDRFARKQTSLPPLADIPVTDQEITSPVYETAEVERSNFYTNLMGDHYRELYYLPINLPVLNLDSIHGGLKPYRRGGGQSTQSLHTAGGNGQLYQIRSVRKNPANLLPNTLEQTFAADLARDQFTAVHPYAPLTLPKMQKALGLLSLDPALYFIPKQDALGDFNTNYGGEMYWLEPRPDEDWSGTGLFADSRNIISSSALRETVHDSWKHRVDQQNFLRARLFDFLIGDWDRHKDQWRWAEIEQADGTSKYLPVARDRDQVYANFDGVLLRLAGLFVPEARKLRPFGYQLDRIKWRALNGKWNDRFLLNEMERKDFLSEAAFIQNQLTDSLIDVALRDFPSEVQKYSLQREDIDQKLKSRRDQLLAFAEGYYRILARSVTVTATNKDDYIKLEGTANGGLRLRLFDADANGQADELYYDRTFNPKETKEVNVYGLDGNDQFQLAGDDRSPIRLRIIGGTDQDQVTASGPLKAKVYDNKSGMVLMGKRSRLLDRRNNRHPELNLYNFKAYQPNHLIPMPNFGYNIDDGLYIGLGAIIRRYGFQASPYTQQHQLMASISTNETIKFDYQGIFNNAFGPAKDFILDLAYRSPDFVVNFFGLGNTSANPSVVREFNRSRQERRFIRPQFRFRGRVNRVALSISPYYESYKISLGEANESNTLISQPGIVPERVFSRQNFVGSRLAFTYNNVAVPHMPDNGLKMNAVVEHGINLNTQNRSFTKLSGDITYYKFFGRQTFGFATRIGFEHIQGEFEFYQAAHLGGRTNFRAARSERFLGNSAFYHNTDIRIRGLSLGKRSPTAMIGCLLGFDYGRVWLAGEDSNIWHYGYGGGLWVAPLNAAIISITYFTSDAGNRVNIGGGFPF